MVSPRAFVVLRLMTSLKLRGLLHGQVGRVGASEELVHVGGGLADRVDTIHRVRQEAARICVPSAAHRGQVVSEREFGEAGQMTGKRGIELDEERIRPRLSHHPKGGLELLGPSRADDL
jgi:hypothetical protein